MKVVQAYLDKVREAEENARSGMTVEDKARCLADEKAAAATAAAASRIDVTAQRREHPEYKGASWNWEETLAYFKGRGYD